jgi:hypothetical protein
MATYLSTTAMPLLCCGPRPRRCDSIELSQSSSLATASPQGKRLQEAASHTLYPFRDRVDRLRTILMFSWKHLEIEGRV